LFYKPRGPSSPRIRDRRVREKILELIEQRPSRTVPQLRRLLSADGELAEAVGQVSDRSIYRFLAEAGLTQKARREKSFGPGKKSYHKFEASCSMELVQGDARLSPPAMRFIQANGRTHFTPPPDALHSTFRNAFPPK
jgi:hypothetical protein